MRPWPERFALWLALRYVRRGQAYSDRMQRLAERLERWAEEQRLKREGRR